MTLYLGIDPGLDGGLAFVAHDGHARVEATPTTTGKRREYLEAAMRSLIDGVGSDVVAAIESAQAMPKQGVRSMFSIGLGFGLWRGLLSGLQIPYYIERPQVWRAGVGLAAKADKGASVALAQRLFPNVAGDLMGPRGGLRDGLAEALLIAEWRRGQSLPSTEE